MSTHTPGPWTAVPESGQDSEGDWCVSAPDEDVIAAGLSEPDARLIAAAPDLLAALKAIVKDQESTGVSLGSLSQAARAAIAKAEGKS